MLKIALVESNMLQKQTYAYFSNKPKHYKNGVDHKTRSVAMTNPWSRHVAIGAVSDRLRHILAIVHCAPLATAEARFHT